MALIKNNTRMIDGLGTDVSYKNILDNGDFNIYQREYLYRRTSTGIFPNSPTSGQDYYGRRLYSEDSRNLGRTHAFVTDRWKSTWGSGTTGGFAGEAYLNASDSDLLGTTSCYVYNSGDSEYGSIASQEILPEDYARIAGKTVTLSFWVKSDTPTSFFMETQVHSLAPPAGVTTVWTPTICKKYSANSSWSYKTFTFKMPSYSEVQEYGYDQAAQDVNNTSNRFNTLGGNIGKLKDLHTQIQIRRKWSTKGEWRSHGNHPNQRPVNAAGEVFQPDTAISEVEYDSLDETPAEIYLANIQLEIGDKATPFERKSYTEELRNCQRTYYMIDSLESFAFGSVQFPTKMFRTPDVYFRDGYKTYLWYRHLTADGVGDGTSSNIKWFDTTDSTGQWRSLDSGSHTSNGDLGRGGITDERWEAGTTFTDDPFGGTQGIINMNSVEFTTHH